MQETTKQRSVTLAATDELVAAAKRAGEWAGEPFLHNGEEPPQALAPGTAPAPGARRSAGRDRGGPQGAVPRVEGALRAHARPRARALREAAEARFRHRAAPPSDRRAGRDAHRADRRRAAQRGARERERQRSSRSTSDEEDDEPEPEAEAQVDEEPEAEEEPPPEEDPGAVRRYRFRHPTASGKTIAAAGFVEAARTMGVLILTHRRLLVSQFIRELTAEGYGDRLTPDRRARQEAAQAEPGDHPDVRVVRAPRRQHRPRRVPARHRRRGAHGARREDEPARSGASRSPSTSG